MREASIFPKARATNKTHLNSVIPRIGMEALARMTVKTKLGGKVRRIDKGIADVVKKLNEHGYKTVHSCSSLREDHPSRAPRDRSDGPYVCIQGKYRELTEIAEESGWNWEFSGYSDTKDGRPVDHVDFIGNPRGQVFKVTSRALEKPEIGPEGRPILWKGSSRTNSSKEEAMEGNVQFTQLTLEPGDDLVIKQRISRLLEVINRKFP